MQLDKNVLEMIAADVNGTIDTATLDLVKHECDAMVPIAVMVPEVNGANATCQVVYEKGKIPCKIKCTQKKQVKPAFMY